MNFIVIGNREWFKSEGKNVTYLKLIIGMTMIFVLNFL